jgi:arginase
MIGTRDVDPLERDLLEASFIRIAPRYADVGANLDAIMATAGAPDLYLHLDLDTLDASEGRANGYAVAGGLSRSDLLAAINEIGSRGALRAASITAYDPDCDSDDRVGRIAIEAATRVVIAARAHI